MTDRNHTRSERICENFPAKNISLTVIELFRRQVLINPGSVALEVDGVLHTYAEIDAHANKLAHFLIGQGIKKGETVAICLPRTKDLVISLLAILKAGAAYLPINPSDPAARIEQMINRAEARAIVTNHQGLENVRKTHTRLIVLETEAAKIEIENILAPTYHSVDVDFAYVICTSGTTGVPKCVAICHRALTNIVNDTIERIGFSKHHSWIAVTTISFDIAALELFVPLVSGGRIILATDEEIRDGSRLARLLALTKADVMQATPITWRLLLEAGWQGNSGLTVLCGGDYLDRELAEQILDRCMNLWNMYGPTETTIWSMAERVSHDRGNVTLGTPVANTTIYLLGKDRKAVPHGNIGEIYIGGDGLASCYVNDSTLTNEKFICDTYLDSRLYRTGDLGRWNSEGKLEFHGRIDNQVKIRGCRIELVEIENVIRSYPGISDVVVLGVEQEAGNKQLHAFIVLQPLHVFHKNDLIIFLLEYLPELMLPRRFTQVSSFPLTPNNKVDRRALLAQGTVKLSNTTPEVCTTETEVMLSNMWKALFFVSDIDPDATFISLGGDSLLAIRLLGRIKSTFDVDLPFRILFGEETNLRYLSKCIDRAIAAFSNLD